jgi:hypothetical protein
VLSGPSEIAGYGQIIFGHAGCGMPIVTYHIFDFRIDQAYRFFLWFPARVGYRKWRIVSNLNGSGNLQIRFSDSDLVLLSRRLHIKRLSARPNFPMPFIPDHEIGWFLDPVC